MKKIKVFIVAYFISLISYAQNNQILFDFDELPQTLLLNPGANFNNDYYIGVPLLSGISIKGGYTVSAGLSLFNNRSETNFKNEIRDGFSAYRNENKYHFYEKVDIINAGIRLKNEDFLSFGFYQEVDVAAYYPKGIIPLLYENTPLNLNQNYFAEDLAFKAEMIGVLHVGLSHKVNENFTIGGRVKFYSSAFNVQSKNNKGYFNSTLGTNTPFTHNIINPDVLIQSSGLSPYIDIGRELRKSSLKPENIDVMSFAKNIFSFKNAGIGADIGFTYKPNEKLQLSGSVLDIGVINNDDDILTYSLTESRNLDGGGFNDDSDILTNAWLTSDNYLSQLPLKASFNSYNSYRPIKINLAIKYSFGDFYYDNCYVNGEYEDPFKSAIGIHLFSVNRPLQQELAATLFYEHGFGQKLKAKVTYTADTYSYTNFGLGLSSHFGAFNIYFAADNLLSLTTISTKPNYSTFQFGVNLLFDKKYW